MRKNVLIIAHSHGPQFVGIYNQYAQLFDKAKYCVTVLYLTVSPDKDLAERTHAEKVIFAGHDKRKLRFLKVAILKQLINLCRQEKYEFVICHRYKPLYLMLLAAKFCRIPYIIFVMHELNTFHSRRRQWLLRLMMQKNMLLAGVSNAVRDNLRQSLPWIPQQQLVTLYNVIDVATTEPQLLSRQEAREKLNLPEDAFIFGHAGRLEKNKDHMSLINAFASIHQQCPNAKLILMGSGSLKNKLKNYVSEHQLQDKVIFAGNVPYAFRFMKALDCFVLSSSQEAFGYVLLEAMLAKVPVIGTTAHGIPEVIASEGKIVPMKDATALANAMQEMYALSPEKRTHLSISAYQHVLANFSLPAFHRQFTQVMHEAFKVNLV